MNVSSAPPVHAAPRVETSAGPHRHAETPSAGQTTVLHARALSTRDGMVVNVVVALHWHLRDAPDVAPVARVRAKVKTLTEIALESVVGSTPLETLRVEQAIVELKLFNRMTIALGGLRIALQSCRIRAVDVPHDGRDSRADQVLEQLDQVVQSHHHGRPSPR